MLQVRQFTQQDWWGLAGCTPWETSEPLIGYTELAQTHGETGQPCSAMIVADCEGINIYVEVADTNVESVTYMCRMETDRPEVMQRFLESIDWPRMTFRALTQLFGKPHCDYYPDAENLEE